MKICSKCGELKAFSEYYKDKSGKRGSSMNFSIPIWFDFEISDEVTKQLMQRTLDSGFKPEQIARYALKRYLAEISHKEV